MNQQTISLTAKDNYLLNVTAFGEQKNTKGIIFLLSDHNESVKTYADLCERMKISGFHIVLLNDRGYQSEKHGAEIVDLMVEDLEVVMAYYRAEHIDTPFTLLGFGLGGHIALLYMIRHKVKEISGVITVEPWFNIKIEKQGFLPSVFQSEVTINTGTTDRVNASLAKGLEKTSVLVAEEIENYHLPPTAVTITSDVQKSELIGINSRMTIIHPEGEGQINDIIAQQMD